MKITDKCPRCGRQLIGKILRSIDKLALSCENCGYFSAVNIAPTANQEEIAK